MENMFVCIGKRLNIVIFLQLIFYFIAVVLLSNCIYQSIILVVSSSLTTSCM